LPLVAVIGATFAIVALVWYAASRTSSLVQSLRRRFKEGEAAIDAGNPAKALLLFEGVISEARASKIGAIQVVMANAMLKRADVLGRLGRIEDAEATYQEIDARFGREQLTGLQLAACRALLEHSSLLLMARLRESEGGSLERQSELLDVLLGRYGSSSDKYIRRYVAQARVSQAGILGEAGNIEQALAALDGVLDETNRLPGPQSDAAALSAMTQKASLLEERGDLEGALAVRRASRERATLSTSVSTLGQAGAVIGEGRILLALGRPEEALSAYGQLLSLGESGSAVMRPYVIEAERNMANTYWKLGRQREAIATADVLISLARKWGDSDLLKETKEIREAMARTAKDSVSHSPDAPEAR
jgi:tetratricopeptide (TPR) repeat protein